MPSFAYVTNSSHCDNTDLSTYMGPANLTANWQGNNISVTWYNGDTEYDSNQCTYGGNLTMPSNIPTREGYTFRGWRARQTAQCSLSGLNTNINGTWYSQRGLSGFCSYNNLDTGEEEHGNCTDNNLSYESYDIGGGVTIVDLANTHFAGLNSGEWEVGFSYGTVKGMSKCSGLSGNNHNFAWGGNSADWSATESQLTSAGNGQYCWCTATSYTTDGGTQCNIASPSWVFYENYFDNFNCLGFCAESCGTVSDDSSFRQAVFGVQ